MTSHSIDRLSRVAAASATLLLLSSPSASAGVLSNGATFNVFVECINDGVASVYQDPVAGSNGWHYTFDSANDGTGGAVYDIFGMAIKETQDSIVVAINGNMPLSGADSSGAWDTKIGWGDLFINLSPEDNFSSADLFGVRFADPFGDLPVGVYGGVDPISVTGSNHGHKSVQSYTNGFVKSDGTAKKNNVNIDELFGDLSHDTDYFDRSKSYNAIGSGSYLGGIERLDDEMLRAAGFESPDRFGGSETIAFRFDTKLLTSYIPDLESETYTRFIGKNWKEQLQHNAENAGIDWEPWQDQLDELQQETETQLQPWQAEMDELLEPVAELKDLANYVKNTENTLKQLDRNLSRWESDRNKSEEKIDLWERQRQGYQQERERYRELGQQNQVSKFDRWINQRNQWIDQYTAKVENYTQQIDAAQQQKDELLASLPDRTRKELEADAKQLQKQISQTDAYKAVKSQIDDITRNKSRNENQIRKELASTIQTAVGDRYAAQSSASDSASVPEPSTLAGLVVLGAFGSLRQRRRQR